MPRHPKRDEIQFLYLIASGNNDSVYKVGISVDPKARLEQIKHQYRVPKAYIIETMDVPTRQEVLAIESALHARFDAKKSPKYGGREFFRLNQEDLEWLRRLYREKSNDFAQAKAFYGLTRSASELADKARRLERERQSKIDFNRRNGKTYDTKPKGELKRYNDLKNKIKNSHLGERFSIKQVDHPTEKLKYSVHQDVASIINAKTKNSWLKVTGVGFVGGLFIGASSAPDHAMAIALQSGVIGAISGGFGQLSRRETEKTRAMKSIEEAIDTRYPGQRGKKLVAMLDSRTNTQMLIRDFNESSEELRNVAPSLPQVTLPAANEICATYAGKSYLPKVATTVTLCFSLLLSISAAQNEQAKRSVSFQPVHQQPISSLVSRSATHHP